MSDADETVMKRLRLDSDINASSFSSSSSSFSSTSSVDEGTTNQQLNNSQANEPLNSLMRLNDDCLRHVLNYLDEKDLCCFTDVCTRMRPIAVQAFRRRCKEKCVEHPDFDERIFRRIMYKFGHLIPSYHVYGYLWQFPQEHLRTLFKYCTSLNHLALNHLKVDCNMLKFLFERLKGLHFSFCEFDNASTLLTNNSNLEILRISYPKESNIVFIANEFPNLVEFELFPCNLQYFASFQQFLTQNPQLRRLKISVFNARYFRAIAERARNLEELEINCEIEARTEDLLSFKRLTKLKKLVLSGPLLLMQAIMVTDLITAFLRSNMALEHLDLGFCHINSTDIKTIVKLKTLKILHLYRIDCDSDHDLVSLVTDLPLIKKLWLLFKRKSGNYVCRPTSVEVLKDIVNAGKHLDSIRLSNIRNFKIDLIDYEELLEAASNRLNQNKLTIEIQECYVTYDDYATTTIDVPRTIQEMNKHQLEIIFLKTLDYR